MNKFLKQLLNSNEQLTKVEIIKLIFYFLSCILVITGFIFGAINFNPLVIMLTILFGSFIIYKQTFHSRK
jgi:hypothetical protein